MFVPCCYFFLAFVEFLINTDPIHKGAGGGLCLASHQLFFPRRTAMGGLIPREMSNIFYVHKRIPF